MVEKNLKKKRSPLKPQDTQDYELSSFIEHNQLEIEINRMWHMKMETTNYY